MQFVTRSISANLIFAGQNDRKTFKQEALDNLAASIKEDGLAQPPTVRPVGNKYEIVAGERRIRAMRDVLGWTDIPCIVREMSDEEASGVMLTENTSRADLNPIEEAQAYQKRIDEFGWSTSKISKVAGRSKSLIESRLRLLTLIPEVQKLISDKHFPVGHGDVMSDLDKNRQLIAMRAYIKAKSMPLQRFSEICSQLLEQQQQQSLFDMDAFMESPIEVTAIPHRSGKNAVTSAPLSESLPRVQWGMDDNVGDVLERYMAHLINDGYAEAASALGNVYRTLVAHNFTSIATRPVFKPTASCGTVEQEAHEERIK